MANIACYCYHMNFENHSRKATQAVARLIHKTGRPIDYLRLSKLIYLADRQSIIARGIPIVGGHYFSMFKGPVIGEIMDFVNQRSAPGWREMISPLSGHEVKLLGIPCFTALSQSERDILDLTVDCHSQRTTEELVDWCHENCPEYEEVPANKRKPIAVESILKAAHKKAKQIQKIVEEAQDISELDRLLA